MKIVHEQILFDCLEQFEAGVSVDDLMDQYPHAADEIEKFLTVAAQLEQIPVQPTLAAKQKSQKLFLQQAAQLRGAQRQSWLSWHKIQQALLPLASMAIVTVLVGTTFLFASSSAIPGDVLYDTKRWLGTWQLDQAEDATAVFNLNTQQNRERIREVQSLLRTNETADVSFEGIINTKQGDNWIISGTSVHITEQTIVEDGALIGASVVVNGRTKGGHLYATQIIVLNQVISTASPTRTAIQTAEPTQTSTNSPIETTVSTTTQTATPVTSAAKTPTIIAPTGNTATPAATSTPAYETPTTTSNVTATNAPGPTSSATPEPTSSATPDPTSQPTSVPPTPTSQTQPTSTPTPDNDNGNDNGSGNDNDNDNGDRGGGD